MNKVDTVVRQSLFLSKMFTKSWGPPEILKLLRQYQAKYTHQGAVMEQIERDLPQMCIEKDEISDGVQMQEGWFISPLDKLSPHFFRCGQNVAKAVWRGYFPAPGRPRNGLVVHLAPTGDHTYKRRYSGFVKPLLALGVSSIMLQTPFYGERQPKEQYWSRLKNVSDLFVMGAALIVECCFLVRWAREQGHSPVGLSGISMGGYMSSLAATNIRDEPVSLVPLLSWTSAAPVFTQGALANAIEWRQLSKELESNKELKQLLRECDWADMMEDREHPAYQLFPNLPARRLMWLIMDSFTNLKYFPAPLDTSRVHFVVAEQDGYVPRSEFVPDVETLWPGASVNYIPSEGHVTAYFRHHGLFRDKIIQSLDLTPLPVVKSPATSELVATRMKAATTATAESVATAIRAAGTVTAPIGRAAADQIANISFLLERIGVRNPVERTAQK